MAKKRVTTAVTGICGGILMAVLLLYMMIINTFRISNISFLPILAAACAFPLCIELIDEDVMYKGTARSIMILVSFAISLLYGKIVSDNLSIEGQGAQLFKAVLTCSAVLHGSSMAVSLLKVIVNRRKRTAGK
jgi:hypothetical protein